MVVHDSEKWPHRMMNVARLIATWSKDPARKVGCVITNASYHILSTGYNGYPPKMNDSDLSDKLDKTIHAELNAILKLPQSPPPLYLFVTAHPCAQCATTIIQYRDIARVFSPYIALHGSSWGESMELAKTLFEQAGLRQTYMAVYEEE